MSKYRLREGSVSCWSTARAQVLAAQRGKEAAEEREQNVSLSEQVEALRSSAASAAQVRLLTAGCRFAWSRPGDVAIQRTDYHFLCMSRHSYCFSAISMTTRGKRIMAAGGGGDGKGSGAAGGAGADEQDQGATRRGAAQGGVTVSCP